MKWDAKAAEASLSPEERRVLDSHETANSMVPFLRRYAEAGEYTKICDLCTLPRNSEARTYLTNRVASQLIRALPWICKPSVEGLDLFYETVRSSVVDYTLPEVVYEMGVRAKVWTPSISGLLAQLPTAIAKGCKRLEVSPAMWGVLQVERPDLVDPVSKPLGALVGRCCSLPVFLNNEVTGFAMVSS